jgi:O-methyltransferase involved in polyketide biosynthesis
MARSADGDNTHSKDVLIIAEQSATESATGARMKIDFHDVEATLLAPLCARAIFSREFPSIFNDAKAIELVDQIDHDFSTKVAALGLEGTIAIVARAKQFDDKIRAYVNEHQQASVINVGAGLDTTFYRVDNGLLQWYDLDLPNVIDTRRRLLPEEDRTTYLAGSLFDARWCESVRDKENGVFMLAGGVLDCSTSHRLNSFSCSWRTISRAPKSCLTPSRDCAYQQLGFASNGY